jgi:hypothetical protein
MRYPSASSAIETDVRILRSSSTSAIVGMACLSWDPIRAESTNLKPLKLGRNVTNPL